MTQPYVPSPSDRKRISAICLAPDRSVVRAYKAPETCKLVTVDRVAQAARQLGLPVPRGCEPDPASIPAGTMLDVTGLG